MERAAGSALLLVALAAIGACVDKVIEDTSVPLSDVGQQASVVLGESIQQVLVDLEALQIIVASWEESPTDVALQEEAQQAWRVAFASWQRVEVMQLGSLGSSLTVIGGADVRDEVYSWPTVNPCRVDQETVEEAWDDPDFFTSNLVNSYGFDALEQVLFGGSVNACPVQVGIDQAWDGLGEEGVQANRASFAVALSAQLELELSEPVVIEWESDQVGLNEIIRALFYLDKVTKDLKMARPMGLVDCGTEICPEETEAILSGASMDAVVENLEGFRLLFTGGEGAGLDDLLMAAGRQDLADDLLSAIDAAVVACTTDRGMDELVVDELETAEAAYQAVKAVTDLFKGDLTTVLALQIPNEAAGDHD